jgi:hypothetical protein
VVPVNGGIAPKPNRASGGEGSGSRRGEPARELGKNHQVRAESRTGEFSDPERQD